MKARDLENELLAAWQAAKDTRAQTSFSHVVMRLISAEVGLRKARLSARIILHRWRTGQLGDKPHGSKSESAA